MIRASRAKSRPLGRQSSSFTVHREEPTLATYASEPQYDVRVVRHVQIPMPDGVNIEAHMFMPDAPGRFPAVFDCYPYRKDDLSPPGRYHHYLAQRGFVALRLDVRGSGGSG